MQRSDIQARLPEYRDQIKKAESKEEALKIISQHDGVISLPVFIRIFDDIRAAIETKIDQLLGKINPAGLASLPKQDDKTYSDVFTRFGLDAVASFKKKSDVNIKQVTPSYLAKFIDENISALLKHKFFKEITEDQRKELISLLKNNIFFISARTLYQSADDKQHQDPVLLAAKKAGPALGNAFKGLFQNPDEKVSIRDSIESRYKVTNLLCDEYLKVDLEIALLCEEAAIWLEGLYVRTDSLYTAEHRGPDGDVLKDDQGNYKPRKGNPIDESLYKFGLSPFHMAKFYYLPLSKSIADKTALLGERKRFFSVKPAASTEPVREVKTGEIKSVFPKESRQDEVGEEKKDLPLVVVPRETTQDVPSTTLIVSKLGASLKSAESPQLIPLPSSPPALVPAAESSDSKDIQLSPSERSAPSLEAGSAESKEKRDEKDRIPPDAKVHAKSAPINIDSSASRGKVIEFGRHTSAPGLLFYRKLSAKIQELTPEQRIERLHFQMQSDFIELNPLSEEQNVKLKFALGKLKTCCDSYIKKINAQTIWGHYNSIPTAQEIIDIIAGKSKDKLESNPEVKLPHEKLSKIIDQRNTLRGSNLKPDIDAILLALFDRLGEPEETIEIKVDVTATARVVGRKDNQ